MDESDQPNDAYSTVNVVANDVREVEAPCKRSLAIQDLSADKTLLGAPRVTLDNQSVPALDNIPLLAKLGQGGMGSVYYGIHPRLKKEVAVKVLPFYLVERQPDMVKRFLREAQMAAQVHSPHLVSVLDVNEQNGLHYLVMEFVNGTSAGGYLKEIKQSGEVGLQERVALEICIAATDGLAAAHAKGIIHRDIKPDNILLPRSDINASYIFTASKLADLGLGRSEHLGQSLTGLDAIMGTPGYMSPEQAQDTKTAGKQSDVFSMGATLYGLLSGQAPFSRSSAVNTILDTVQRQHPPITQRRADVTSPTAELLNRCLAKKPEDRFADAAELLERLRFCRSKCDQSKSGRFVPRTVAKTDSERAVRMVAGGIAAFVVTAGIFLAGTTYYFVSKKGDKKADPTAQKFTTAKAGNAMDGKASLDKGANPNLRTAGNMTPLMATAAEGDAVMLKALLDKGAEVDSKNMEGRTALMFAARNNHSTALSLLLDHGAKINARDEDGKTALVLAKERGYSNIVDLLRKAGSREKTREGALRERSREKTDDQSKPLRTPRSQFLRDNSGL